MSTPPVLAELTRAGLLESAHRGWIAVARPDGTRVASVGDAERMTFARSAMKPFQAVAMVESGAVERFGFGNTELAVACASHSGEQRHRDVVRRMMKRIDLPISALRAGDDEAHAAPPTSWEPEKQLAQNCSGKHAAMLAACLARGYPIENYDDRDHPHQRTIREIVSQFWRVPASDLIAGRDACTLPAYAAPLHNIASGWAMIADPGQAPADRRDAIARIADAMAAEPFMVAGTGRLNTELIETTQGRILAKDGAEGVLCMAVRDRGLGIAIKVEDGSFRPHGAIALSILRQIDALTSTENERLSALWRTDLRSNRNHQVGDISSTFTLSFA